MRGVLPTARNAPPTGFGTLSSRLSPGRDHTSGRTDCRRNQPGAELRQHQALGPTVRRVGDLLRISGGTAAAPSFEIRAPLGIKGVCVPANEDVPPDWQGARRKPTCPVNHSQSPQHAARALIDQPGESVRRGPGAERG